MGRRARAALCDGGDVDWRLSAETAALQTNSYLGKTERQTEQDNKQSKLN
jgi:hypothetical protein